MINPEFDELCLHCLINEPGKLTHLTTHELGELAGTQGIEILNWIVGRGILGGWNPRDSSQLPYPDRQYGIGRTGTGAAGAVCGLITANPGWPQLAGWACRRISVAPRPQAATRARASGLAAALAMACHCGYSALAGQV